MSLVFILFAVSSSGRVVQHAADPERGASWASFRGLLAPRAAAALALARPALLSTDAPWRAPVGRGTALVAPGTLRGQPPTMLAKRTTWELNTQKRKRPKRERKKEARVSAAGFGQPKNDTAALPSTEPAPAEKDAAGAGVAAAAPDEELSEEERMAAWREYADAAVAAAEAHEKRVAEEEKEKFMSLFRPEEGDE